MKISVTGVPISCQQVLQVQLFQVLKLAIRNISLSNGNNYLYGPQMQISVIMYYIEFQRFYKRRNFVLRIKRNNFSS